MMKICPSPTVPVLLDISGNDTLIPVNHAGRAYYGKNQVNESASSKTRYIEVTNAQRFDTFIAFGALLGYDTRFVPLHVSSSARSTRCGRI